MRRDKEIRYDGYLFTGLAGRRNAEGLDFCDHAGISFRATGAHVKKPRRHRYASSAANQNELFPIRGEVLFHHLLRLGIGFIQSSLGIRYITSQIGIDRWSKLVPQGTLQSSRLRRERNLVGRLSNP